MGLSLNTLYQMLNTCKKVKTSTLKMFARNLRIPSAWRVPMNSKYQSTAAADTPDPVLVDIDEKTGISTVTMNNKPVNNLTLSFLKSFCDKMDFLEKEKVKGMILTSSVKNVFSSGLDFNQTMKPTEEGIHAYWLWFQESWIKLYGSSFPTAALINGHAIAGGCVYALSCEYRVMLPNFLNGLNEAPVGIVAPVFVNETIRNVVGPRKAELALTVGTLYPTDEALKMGLIDEVATDQADARARCEKFLSKFAKVPAMARSQTKLAIRKETLALLKNPKSRSQDAKIFCDYILRPSTQKDLETFFTGIKKSKK